MSPEETARITDVANALAKKVHRAVCDHGVESYTPKEDGSISMEETQALVNGGVWGVAAFVAQAIVVTDAPEGVTPEEAMGEAVKQQFVHAYRAYREQQDMLQGSSPVNLG